MAEYLSELQRIQFARPEFLWLLAALPLLWFRFYDRRLAVILGRTLIVALLSLALADPRSVSQQTTFEERLFAFDVSRSIAPDMRSWMEQSAQGKSAPSNKDRVYLFGADAVQENDWRAVLKGEDNARVNANGTSLEKLLSTLLALPPRPRNLFLFTDGWETQGNVTRLLPLVAGSGLRIFPVVPAEPQKIANVAVTKLLAPGYGNSAEAINLRVSLENYSDSDLDGSMVLERNGQTIKTERVTLKPGSSLLTHETTLPDVATATYRATFSPSRPELDNYAPDNHAVASVTVRTKAKVLLLNGRPGGGRYLEEILKRQGFEITSRPAEAAPSPTGFGVIIFNNAEREKFSPAYLAAVERHIIAGNGFLMLGNEASFSPGSFRGTPIESLLPVEPKEPPKREEKNRSVVLVIDKSGSMREDGRIVYAKEAAKAVARQLKDNDFIGVVGFDVSPFVVVPLANVGAIRGTIDSEIERLKPGGRTYLLPAILEARLQIQRQDASHKHVIILSDGETGGSGGDYIDLVHVMRTQSNITVSAVAIGTDPNLALMKRITQYGGGFFHHTYDPKSLPRIVLQQIQEPPQDESPKERELFPVQDRRSEILGSASRRNFPRVLGYMGAEIKRGADGDLVIPTDNRRDPLLASWRRGSGKSVALLMDMESRFSHNWIQWGGLQGFWDDVIGWLRPEVEAIPLHEARVSLVNSRPVLDLYVYEERSANSQFSFSVSGNNIKNNGALEKLATGHFRTELPISEPGDYKIELSELRRERRITIPNLSYTLPYQANAELPQPRFNTSLLAQLAQISGGEINSRLPVMPNEPAVTSDFTPKRNPLIALALLLFLFEVSLRKIVLAEAD